MRAIDHQLQTGKPGAGGHAALAELDVATRRVIDPRHLANRLGHDHRLVEQRFDLCLDVVGQLGALPREELDAVVVIGIVRGTDDDAGLGMEGAREVGDRRRRHRPKQHHIGTGGHQPGLQGRLEHVAGNARVLADQHPANALTAKRNARCPAQLEHELGSDGELANPTANAVGTEILSRHFNSICLNRQFRLLQSS